MRELSVAEQRYQAVLAVISDRLLISQVSGVLHTVTARRNKIPFRACLGYR